MLKFYENISGYLLGIAIVAVFVLLAVAISSCGNKITASDLIGNGINCDAEITIPSEPRDEPVNVKVKIYNCKGETDALM